MKCHPPIGEKPHEQMVDILITIRLYSKAEIMPRFFKAQISYFSMVKHIKIWGIISALL
jgi:hypothetical protein